MNVFNFSGNLGRDAEQRHLTSGDSIVSFSVAVKAGFGDKAVTSWIKCNLWGKRGDSLLQYLKKGQLVGISGEFECREYQDKEGATKQSNEVRVNIIDLYGKGNNAQAPAAAQTVNQLVDDVPF
jgi:single-strand DNA-binding protein